MDEEPLGDEDTVTADQITPRELFRFATFILLFLWILFAIGMICEMIKPSTGIFEACKNIIMPVGMFIIGFYFSKK